MQKLHILLIMCSGHRASKDVHGYFWSIGMVMDYLWSGSMVMGCGFFFVVLLGVVGWLTGERVFFECLNGDGVFLE